MPLGAYKIHGFPSCFVLLLHVDRFNVFHFVPQIKHNQVNGFYLLKEQEELVTHEEAENVAPCKEDDVFLHLLLDGRHCASIRYYYCR